MLTFALLVPDETPIADDESALRFCWALVGRSGTCTGRRTTTLRGALLPPSVSRIASVQSGPNGYRRRESLAPRCVARAALSLADHCLPARFVGANVVSRSVSRWT